jgi:hypothetical protein
MSPLEPLAPDQRAVVALVLQQGRSYDEIAALLGIPVDAVRARAHAGLAALAPASGLPLEVTGPLADYLLGQQPAPDAEATRGLLAESAPARAWATGVADQLAGLAPGALPEIPQGGDAPAGPAAAPAAEAPRAEEPAARPQPRPSREAAEAAPPSRPPHEARAQSGPAHEPTAAAPRPRPARETAPAAADPDAPPPSSRLGGVLLIAAVVAVVGVVLFLVLRGGDDDPSADRAADATPTATATPSPTAEPRVTDEIPLRAPGRGKPTGAMTVYLQGGQLLFALQAQQVPPNGRRDSYAIWLTGPGARAHRLGFTEPVGANGQLGIQGPSETDLQDFPRLYAGYANVVVSRETKEDARRPSQVVLSGKLPAGR